MNRRLYRCSHDRRIAGVAGGLAEYLDVDPTLIRVLWVVSIFFGGLGLLLYIIMALVVPPEPQWYPGPVGAAWGSPQWPSGPTPADSATQAGADDAAGPASAPAGTGSPAAAPWAAGAPGAYGPGAGWHHPEPMDQRTRRGSGFGLTFAGIALILFGALALVETVLPSWADQGRFLWPAFILGLGVLLVVTAMRRRPEQQ